MHPKADGHFLMYLSEIDTHFAPHLDRSDKSRLLETQFCAEGCNG